VIHAPALAAKQDVELLVAGAQSHGGQLP
jgi:hypothetical protein